VELILATFKNGILKPCLVVKPPPWILIKIVNLHRRYYKLIPLSPWRGRVVRFLELLIRIVARITWDSYLDNAFTVMLGVLLRQFPFFRKIYSLFIIRRGPAVLKRLVACARLWREDDAHKLKEIIVVGPAAVLSAQPAPDNATELSTKLLPSKNLLLSRVFLALAR
jgi:hypothetical protein